MRDKRPIWFESNKHGTAIKQGDVYQHVYVCVMYFKPG